MENQTSLLDVPSSQAVQDQLFSQVVLACAGAKKVLKFGSIWRILCIVLGILSILGGLISGGELAPGQIFLCIVSGVLIIVGGLVSSAILEAQGHNLRMNALTAFNTTAASPEQKNALAASLFS